MIAASGRKWEFPARSLVDPLLCINRSLTIVKAFDRLDQLQPIAGKKASSQGATDKLL